MTEIYKIAEKIIKINSLYGKVHEYCKDYRYNGTPDFTVTTSQDDIEFERKRSALNDIEEGRPVYDAPDDYLEELAVYRKIAEKMPDYDTFLFHGSVIAVDGSAYMFTAKSGTGKSTHTRMWRSLFGERAVMVNDDKPLIRITDTGAVAYGTPYNGKHRLGSNIAVPLKAVCILERAENNSIHPVTKEEAYSMLLQQCYRPMSARSLMKTLTLIDKLADTAALWKLGCNISTEAAQTAYEAMK